MRSSSPSPPRTIPSSRSRSWWRTASTAARPRARSHGPCSTITSPARSRRSRRPHRRRRPEPSRTRNMINRAFDFLARRIDGPLMAAIALTVALGLTVVYSASGGGSPERVLGQGRNVALALAALWLFAQVPPQTLMRLALPAYIAGLALLVGVALFGEVRNGARRWLTVGFTLQPSEIMKIA